MEFFRTLYMYEEGKNHARLYGGMFQICIQVVSGLILGWNTGYHHCGFPQSLQANTRTAPQFAHDHLIQNLS